MLLEKLSVVSQLVLADERQVLVVNHVVVAVKEDVVDVVDQDDQDYGDEVRWVDTIMAIFHEESRDEKTKCDQMHADAEDLVENSQLAVVHFVILLSADHRVDDQAEGDEEGILREQ